MARTTQLTPTARPQQTHSEPAAASPRGEGVHVRHYKHLFILLLVALVATVGCRRSIPIRSATEYPIPSYTESPVTTERVGRAIQIAGTQLGWVIARTGDGRSVGTLDMHGKHRIVVDITYTTTSYSIVYQSSDNMKYDATKGNIHRNYNRWVSNLVKVINSELAQL